MNKDRYLLVFKWGKNFDLTARRMEVSSIPDNFPPRSNGRYQKATDALVAAHLREANEGFEYGVVCSPDVLIALEEESKL